MIVITYRVEEDYLIPDFIVDGEIGDSLEEMTGGITWERKRIMFSRNLRILRSLSSGKTKDNKVNAILGRTVRKDRFL